MVLLCGATVSGATGCQRIGSLFEEELDDSADAMSGRWNVASVSESGDNCDTMEAVESPPDFVEIDAVPARSEAAPAEARTAADTGTSTPAELIDVFVCEDQTCSPAAGRYSRFEKAAVGWSIDEFTADWSRHPACLGRRSTVTFVPSSESRARMEIVRSLGEWLIEGPEQCDDDLARARKEALSCHHRRVFELRRPADRDM